MAGRSGPAGFRYTICERCGMRTCPPTDMAGGGACPGGWSRADAGRLGVGRVVLPAVRIRGAVALAYVLFAAGAGVGPAHAQERERNFWPFLVQQIDAESRVQSWTAAGPLVFSRPIADGGTVRGVRPFWVQTTNENGELREGLGVYPLYSWNSDRESYRWSVFQLIKHHDRRADAPPPASTFDHDAGFDVWPFWFSRQTADPDTSYRALFPIAGTLRHRLGFERISWAPFPLFVRTEERGAITTHTPWPILRVTRGEAHGFGVWPLYSVRERPGHSREAFYLWPLGYDRTTEPDPEAPADTPPTREVGALPFYTRSSGPGYRSENYLWPFFGYTDRTAPARYHETRYLWPFLVQGDGEDRFVRRWGPFYTHSLNNGYEKTWVMWPLYRRLVHADDVLTQTKHQVGYFLYWSLEQRSRTNPDLPAASVRHLWPLFSAWDNGAGHRQFQFPSPLEVFFPANQRMRQTWNPLFSLYRQESRGPGHVRASLLWNGITWERDASEDRREFHLGPLLTIAGDADRSRFEIGHGLFGTARDGDRRTWRLFWFTLGGKRAGPVAPTSPPT